MKKLTGKQLRLVITLVIVIIFALSYEYIYMHFVNMTGDYKEKTELMKAQITQRQNELEQEDKILMDTVELNSQINEKLASFPITLTKEENLLFIETMEKDLRMEITPIMISEPSVFYTTKLLIRDENGNELTVAGESSQTASVPAELGAQSTADTNNNAISEVNDATVVSEVTTTDEETMINDTATKDPAMIEETNGQQFMTVLQSSIDITFQTTYPKFKKVLKYIKEYPEKLSVSNATLSYDSSTGDLLAAMKITRYAMTGTGKKYEEPYIGDISIGTDNLFGDPTKE